MKKFLIVILTAFTTQVQAQDSKPLSALKEFIGGKQKCLLAVGQRKFVPGQDRASRVENPEIHYESIFCVDDMVDGEGTVDEIKGCTVYMYNPGTSRALLLKGARSWKETMTPGISCSKGGFEKLMAMKMGTQVRTNYGWEHKTFGSLFKSGFRLLGPTYLIHASEDKYKNY